MNTVSVLVGKSGRVVLPAAHRRAAGIKPGDKVMVSTENGRISISTYAQQVREAQAFFKKHYKGKVSLADELIRERRAEAARE